LRHEHLARRRLHGGDIASDRPLEVDLVARTFQDVAAALAAVEEPWPRTRRADAAPSQEGDPLPVELAVDIVEQLERVPLVADGADDAGALGGVDDGARVLGLTRDRLLEVERQAARQHGDGALAVHRRRRAEEDGVELLALEQLVEARVDGGADRPSRSLGPRAVDVADGDHGRSEPPEHVDVILRDPAGAHDRDSHGSNLPPAGTGRATSGQCRGAA
jgi:hypothetical protein